MPTRAERRERQDGMFMPKAALAHFMAVMRMLQDRPEENGSRTSAGAHLYVRTADVIEAHAVGGRGLHIFQCYGSRLGKTQ
ncbi:unnamed protein product [Boreogadus saida]